MRTKVSAHIVIQKEDGMNPGFVFTTTRDVDCFIDSDDPRLRQLLDAAWGIGEDGSPVDSSQKTAQKVSSV